jgi:hypothetical protein
LLVRFAKTIEVVVAVVPTYTSYAVAPETAPQFSVTEVVVTKELFVGKVFVPHPGNGGAGGLGLSMPPFLLHALIIKVEANMQTMKLRKPIIDINIEKYKNILNPLF